MPHLDWWKRGKLLVGKRKKWHVGKAWGRLGLSLGVHGRGTDTRHRVGARSLVATLLWRQGTEVLNFSRAGVTVGADVVRDSAGLPEGWVGW